MSSCVYQSAIFLFGAMLIIAMSTFAAPMETDDDQIENSIVVRPEVAENENSFPWESLDTASLRKLLMQLDSNRFGYSRVSRASTGMEPRGWYPRSLDTRIPARPWRSIKRQNKFVQCYFNPVSCFRK